MSEKLRVPSYIDEVLKQLKAEGVHILELKPIFIENRKPYLYLPDDTHWNKRAIKLTAEHLNSKIKNLVK